MKLEEYLIGTRKEISDNIDKLETEKKASNYLLKWGAYSIAELTLGLLGAYFGEKLGVGTWNIVSVPLVADFITRYAWTYGSIIKNVSRINRETKDQPYIEGYKGRIKTLRPGLASLVREYFNKK